LVEELRNKCAGAGLIRLYTNGTQELLDIPGWHKHQHIRKDRYTPSELPSPEDCKPLATKGQPSGNQLATSGLPSIGEGRGVKSSLVKFKEPPCIPPLKGETNASSGQVKELFDLWNSLGVVKHKKLTGDMTRAIVAASRDFSVAEISQAMKNYAHIVNDEECYFKYRWTLRDFLKRGLEKFLDLKVALGNYLKGGGAGETHQQVDKEPSDARYQQGLE